MRSLNPMLALGIAGLLLGAGACADPVTLRDEAAPTQPPRTLEVIVHNLTGGSIEVALETDHAALDLGAMLASLEQRFQVDANTLGGGGVGRLVALDGGTWVMRSDPVWIEPGAVLDFTVTAGGIVWKRS